MELNVLALVKDEERYIYLYDDDSVETLLKELETQSKDNELSFSWFDSVILKSKVYRLLEERDKESSEYWDQLNN